MKRVCLNIKSVISDLITLLHIKKAHPHKKRSILRFCFLILLVSLFCTESAYAYLDPGSGSALISTIAATIGALWYSLKSLGYRLFGKNRKNTFVGSQKKSMVLFNEGKAYWGTFRPLVEELIKKEIPFRYRTLDLHDPGLTIESPFMDSKRLSKNVFGLSELAKIITPIMVATSPNIGTPGYPLKRPKHVKNMVHVFHAVADISFYRKNSLDHYDTVILSGDFQRKSIRDIESLRGLKQKELTMLGLPYLDDLYQNKPSYSLKTKHTIILVGSSWGSKGCLQEYGTGFIRTLSEAGFSVIIRPHPHSFIFEPEYIEKCKKETADLPLVRWDSAISPSNAMYESQILISDTSALRFDYAFLYEKPVITLDIPVENYVDFEADDLDMNWNNSASFEIGKVVDASKIKELPQIVKKILDSDTQKGIQSFRDDTVKNFGQCAPSIVSYINCLQQNINN